MNPKRYTTIKLVDQRLAWLDLEIKHCEVTTYGDCCDPAGARAKSRLKNLLHERKKLLEHRDGLLTPIMI